MPIARTWSIALFGVCGIPVEIEADIGVGLPGTTLVGLPDPGLREAKDRVRSAVRNSRCDWPNRKLTLGLSPANLPKVGSAYDLGIALAVLAAAGTVPEGKLAGTVLLGELSLDGRIRPVRGVLPSVLCARDHGLRRIVVPNDTLAEAGLVDGVEVLGAGSLAEVLAWCRGAVALRPAPEPRAHAAPTVADLADVTGQPEARWALEVAAAGGHHILFLGPSGTGKSMLARRLPGLLPPLSIDEALEVTAVHSVDGSLSPDAPLVRTPPFIAPHHSISIAALVGGGARLAAPGAISKAHRGVLFLDESCEFGANSLDSLRTALEEGEVRLARARGVVTYPARFQLVLATNPCPCASPTESDCTCSAMTRRRYLGKLSGPLLDRVDISVQMRPVTTMHAHLAERPESTATVRERVVAARGRARQRWAEHGWLTNADVPGPRLRTTAAPDRDATALLDRGLQRGFLTARGADKCLRLAWTLADLAGRSRPGVDEVAAAMDLRDRTAI
ncbi:YifB family Mg chelatase-like AAA ATPase [Haloechinothrix salitolerans]|uniref:YifB family Mg chelatase-like AAA ATPase n=1 Tax=Haloechinothrix salitolerans TaxID=926830 RepID=A0ABW2C5P3_9PSEU